MAAYDSAACKWDVKAIQSQGYKVGSIMRVKMKNFLTYDECEVFPGPRLNIVIGPNGTGKSALTHAICLACCGTPGDIGRSKDLRTFVKTGTKVGQDTYVEIDILQTPTNVVKVRRTINRDDKGSGWLLNNKEARQKEVKEIMKMQSIDVDNLCSFMPQDKVGDFTRFTPIETLQHTLRAIIPRAGEKNLHDEQVELSDIEKLKIGYQREMSVKQRAYDSLSLDIQNMRTEVERVQQRDKLKETMDNYEIKLVKVVAEELDARLNEHLQYVEEAKKNQRKEAEKIEPLEQRVRELKKQQRAREKSVETATNKDKDIDLQLKRQKLKVNELQEKIFETSMDVSLIETQRKNNEKALEKAIFEQQDCEQKLQIAVDLLPQVQQKLDINNSQNQMDQEQIQDLEEELMDINAQDSALREVLLEQTADLNNLHDAREVFKDRLLEKRRNCGIFTQKHINYALEAMDLVDKNQDTWRIQKRLKGTITGPILMHIAVDEPAVAVIMEKVIPENRLFGFIVECEQDKQLLLSEFRKARSSVDRNKGILTDIYTINNKSRPPPQDKAIIGQFQDLGMQGYVSDHVTAPSIVVDYLNTWHKFNLLLWCRNDGRGTISNEQLKRLSSALLGSGSMRFSLYMHAEANAGSQNRKQSTQMNIIEFSCYKSRHAVNAAPTSSSLNLHPKRLISGTVQDEGEQSVAARREAINTAIEVTNRKRERMQDRKEEKLSMKRTLNEHIVRLRSEKKGFINQMKVPEQHKKLLNKIVNKIRDLEEKLSIDAESEAAGKKQLYKKQTDQLVKVLSEGVETAKNSLEQLVVSTVASSVKNDLVLAIQEAQTAKDTAQNAMKAFENAVRDANEQASQAEYDLNEKTQEFEAIIKRFGSEDQFASVWEIITEECPEETTDEIKTRLFELRGEINAVVENPQLMQRFEESKQELERTKAELDKATADHSTAEESLKARAAAWVKAVKSICTKLDHHFAAYMEAMNNQGAIQLEEIGTFDQFEMKIKVRFKEECDLAELDKNKQSGGERAVATVMYLMALQELTSSPFRVVDEINQGMDEANERLTIDRIVSSCCGDDSKPQYFLVTPKLLQGLRALEHEDVSVLVVYNGSGIKGKWKFDEVKSLLQKMRRRQLGDDEEEGASSNSRSQNIPPEVNMATKRKKGGGVALECTQEGSTEKRARP